MRLDELPYDIVWLIMEYKREMEHHEHWIAFLTSILGNLLWQ